MPEPEKPPLRVALLDSIPEWGGGEKWCLEAAAALRRRGHFVAVGAARGRPLALRAREAGLPLFEASVGRLGWRPGSALRFARFLARERIGLVVGNVGRDLRMGAVACRLAGAALLQRRGLLRPLRPGPLQRWLYRHEVRRVVVNSSAIRDRMRESAPWLDPARFVVIPNGVDTSRPPAGDGARLRAELGLAPAAPLAAVVGRLEEIKGQDVLIEAWPAVQRAVAGAVLLVVGEGRTRAALEARAAALGVAESVRFTGFRREPSDVHAAIDLLVVPSRSEGCSNALLEAMWHARAAVVSDCGGLVELARDGVTARVVRTGDSAALGQAVAALLADPATRRRMGDAARARVEREYSLARVTDALETVLRAVEGERRAG